MNFGLIILVILGEVTFLLLFISIFKFFNRSESRQPSLPKKTIKDLKF